ncbi:hypothetical protein GCM10027517_16700 [Phycicoccus ginsengisoli]
MGADARAPLFRGEASDGRAYAVKTSTRPQPGVAVAAHLADAGVPGVPGPLHALDGGLTSVLDGDRLSVVPWVADHRGLDEGLRPGHWRSLGAVLGALHRVSVHTPVLRDLPRADRDPRPLLGRLHELDRLLGATGSDDPYVDELGRLWAGRGRERLLAVAELARTTADDRHAWADAPWVVAHTDPHSGNVLLADDGQDGVWLVDWDDAAVATPEWDLMFVLGGVLATPSEADRAAVVEGYGAVRLDPARLRYAQATRALHDFLDFADDVLATDRLPEADRRWSVEVLAGQLSPDGLVAFALGERGPDRLGP